MKSSKSSSDRGPHWILGWVLQSKDEKHCILNPNMANAIVMGHLEFIDRPWAIVSSDH